MVSYTYDVWGKLLSTTGTLASTLGVYNPLRYRGYFYDTETGLYYLMSRYYNPTWGRFINADIFITTGQGIVGSNMFVYCNNNPVMNSDTNGCRPIGERTFGNGLIGYTDSGTGGYKLINGQQLEPYKSMSYGYSSIGYSGCEAIACYNALVVLGRAESFDRVKTFFTERFTSVPLSGWRAGGLLGGTPNDVSCFFKSRNITSQASGNLLLLNNMGDSPGVIIRMYWNKPIYYGYHTVAIKYDGSSYLAYNQDVWRKDPVSGISISEYMSNDWRFMYGYYIPYQ